MTYGHQRPALLSVTPPAIEPLTLTEAKLFARIDGSSEDTLIGEMIRAVREKAEHFLRRSLITQSWKLVYDERAPAEVALPMGPVQAITSVKRIARDESETVVDASTYYLNGGKDRLIFDSAPLGHRVEMTYTAGYGDAVTDVPESIRQGMLLHLVALYEGRNPANDLPMKTVVLYAPYREVAV